MLEVELFGTALASGVPGAPSLGEMRRLCLETAATAGVSEGHVAIEFVDAERIAALNREHRGRPAPTDVLSFPIDGVGPIDRAAPIDAGPIDGAGSREADRDDEPRPQDTSERELGDVVICPEHTSDLREALVHGMLHLLGMDHESDDGEMLERQRELLRVRG